MKAMMKTVMKTESHPYHQLDIVAGVAAFLGVLLSVVPIYLAYGYETQFSLGTLIGLHMLIIISPVLIKLSYILHLFVQHKEKVLSDSKKV